MSKVRINAELLAAQRGKALHKWVDDKTASGSLQVLTDATLYYDLEEDEVVMITSMSYNLESVSDNCTFEMVSCAAVAGGGAATQLCAKTHLFTPATGAETGMAQIFFDPPIRVVYDEDDLLSISCRINANDSSAVIHVGWMGFVDLSKGI